MKQEKNEYAKHELYKALLSPRGSDSLSSKSSDCSDIMVTPESVFNWYTRYIRYRVVPLFICHRLGCYSEERCPAELSNKSFMKKLETVEQGQKEDLVIKAHVTFAQMQLDTLNRIRLHCSFVINGMIL